MSRLPYGWQLCWSLALNQDVRRLHVGMLNIALYNNKTARVWFLRVQKHTSDGLWPRKPPRRFPGQRPLWVFLLPQKSHSCGFIFILCHKNYRKAMTLRWRRYDITSTCPTIRMTSLRFRDDTDATEEVRFPHMLYLIFLYHPRKPRLNCRTPLVKVCKFFTKYIALGHSARSRTNFARKGILVCVCMQKWF
jgi:hypothetical protein